MWDHPVFKPPHHQSTSHHLAHPGPPAAAFTIVLSTWLPASTHPTSLDECFLFNSLLVGLPYSLIFCQFWLFLFLNCCCPSFGCARRHSMSTYTFILARSPFFFFLTFFKFMFKYSFLPFILTHLHHPSPPHLLPSPLWSLSACSQFQCLWLYFACLFVLLIRFHL